MERRLSKIETLTLAKNYIINLTHIILAKRNEESALEFNGVLMNATGGVGGVGDSSVVNGVEAVEANILGLNGTAATNGNGLIALPGNCYDDVALTNGATYNCTLLAAEHHQNATPQALTTATTTIQIQNQPLNHMHHQPHHIMISNHNQILMPQHQTLEQQQQTPPLQQQQQQQTAIIMNGYGDSTGDNNNFDEPFREFL